METNYFYLFREACFDLFFISPGFNFKHLFTLVESAILAGFVRSDRILAVGTNR
jgi:hypothetical protein